MYAKISYVLTSENNLNVLLKGVEDLCDAKQIVCTPQEMRTSLEYQLKYAIENNIAGTRYLTNENQLSTANLHIVMKAVNDLKALKSRPILEKVLSEQDYDQMQSSQRRQEVKVRDRSFSVEKVDDTHRFAAHAVDQKTPRQLWG